MKASLFFRSPTKDYLTSQQTHNDSMDVSSLIMDSKIFRPAYNRLPAFSTALPLNYKSHSVLPSPTKDSLAFLLDYKGLSGLPQAHD